MLENAFKTFFIHYLQNYICIFEYKGHNICGKTSHLSLRKKCVLNTTDFWEKNWVALYPFVHYTEAS